MKQLMRVVLIGIIFISCSAFANVAKEDWVLIFFYSQHCDWCHKQAPELLEVVKKMELSMIANSLEETEVPLLEPSISDINLFRTFKVHEMPAIWLYSRNYNKIIQVSKGYYSASMLEDKLNKILANVEKINDSEDILS